MRPGACRATAIRWLKFNLVGGIGIAVQLLALVVLKNGLHFNYLIATALAVETAVIHNFLWHERFTWAERTGASLDRFLKFNLTTGLFSIGGNLALMKLLVDFGHMNYLLANGITITACSVVNFLVSDGFVFAEDVKLSPCDGWPGARPTRYLPAFAQRDKRAPSSRISGA
ncbi:MAG: GtrA family protein [Terriglobales bacterium]